MRQEQITQKSIDRAAFGLDDDPASPFHDLEAELDALQTAARDLTDRSPLDSDPEGLGGDWCHFCAEGAGYTKSGEPYARHLDWCPWAALRQLTL